VKWTGGHKEDQSLKRTMGYRTETRQVQHLMFVKPILNYYFPIICLFSGLLL